MWFQAGLDAREYCVDTEISRRRVPRCATDAEVWSLGILNLLDKDDSDLIRQKPTDDSTAKMRVSRWVVAVRGKKN